MSPHVTIDARGDGILDGRQVRAMAFVPARRQLLDRLTSARSLHGGRALVVGGGYSPIPADLRDRGFEVTAVDSSPAATDIARGETPGVTFCTAPATELGVEAESFDLVYVADTVEVSDDLDGVLAQLAGAARPGATIVVDTVTDTVVAKLIYLIAFPRLPLTRIMPAGRYSAARLRNPRALTQACRRVGIEVNDIVGFEPASVISLVRAVLDRRAGRLADDDLAQAVDFHLSDAEHAPVVTYFAVATKR